MQISASLTVHSELKSCDNPVLSYSQLFQILIKVLTKLKKKYASKSKNQMKIQVSADARDENSAVL
jgi:hypothetical protein